jgi:hypothetical protein
LCGDRIAIIFGSELPEEAFAGVFEQPRQRNWREVDL